MNRVHQSYEAPTIEVRCATTHPESPYIIARLWKLREGWSLMAAWKHAEIDGVEINERRQREDIQVRIDGRVSWNLHCETCGTTVPSRDDRLQSICDTLNTAGVFSIDLQHLAARLRRSETR